MQKFLHPASFCLAVSAVQAQSPIVINQSDMPDTGDTLRVSQTLLLPGTCYQTGGANQTWDFSNLVPTAQRVEKFVTVASTGTTTQLIFNNQLLFPNSYSTIAQQIEVPAVPGGPTQTDTYAYFRETSTQFRQTGLSGNMNGQVIPVAFTSPDVLYRFPVTYNTTDSSDSGYLVNLPGTAYLSHEQHRVNRVDGWGTLITPFGTFQTMRIVSTVTATDTVNYSGQGVRIEQPLTRQYKWMAKSTGTPKKGIPMLEIVTQELLPGQEVVTSVSYRDIYRNLGPSGLAQDLSGVSVVTAPNPFSNQLTLTLVTPDKNPVQVELFDALGRNCYRNRFILDAATPLTIQLTDREISTGAGFYFLRIVTGQGTSTRKLIRLD